ncbi:threonine ammonia-lyase [Bacillus carboniphilus]|uniref:Threonine ammonia-lyase n=1 Tax=Bacillus carboniphilus TaxID=86663 RepID=A0ABN0W7W7_9BACI
MITLKDVQTARENINDITRVTPVLTSELLSEMCGNQLYFKAEHLQKTGSFKIRGATNRVKQAALDGAKHVTAASSGNHGQAVSYIANQLHIPATIVVPVDASQCKINAIESYGGKIEKCGTTSGERLPRAKYIAEEKNGVFIPPYDDPFIMAGQGTVGLEILDQIKDVDAVVVPVGGGGLISGVLTAIKESNPKVKIIGVEPEIANDTYLSLKKGKITSIPATTTIADGLRTNQPGDLTFPVLQKYLDDLVLVSEDEIKQAFSLVLERMKQMIEPSSATTVAAALSGKLGLKGKRVVTVISGGNVDLAQLPQFIVSIENLW